ncbi:MAG: DHA2 family efflux MFS transporter permease subunit [Solirubrobacterales bacterium]|nr:DHA2 family efflux MFS transporter permease subunit [Solirubrobacterales bacterium]
MVSLMVVLASFMSILDTTVVNVAIAAIAADFGSPLNTIQWTITGYTLALALVIPLTGWAADRFGTKRLYLATLSIFLLGSALSGLAWSAESLIAFRVLQGIGGGMLMPAGMTILTHAAGPERVGRVISVLGIPILLGPILGPVLGGWLVESFSWRWVFFINLPIGLVALMMSWRYLEFDRPQPHAPLDWLGFALLIPGLAAVIFGIAQINAIAGVTVASPRVLIPVAVGFAALWLFTRHSLRATHALIDLRLFKDRIFGACTGTLFLGLIAVFGGLLLLPLYLQTVRGESPSSTGLLLAPQGLGAVIALPIAGWLADRVPIGRIVPVGLGLIALSFWALTDLTPTTGYFYFAASVFVMGAGMGVTMVPMFSGAMRTLTKPQVARASTSINIVQQSGAAIGTVVLSIVLSQLLADSPIPGLSATAALDSLSPIKTAAVSDAYATAFGWVAAMTVVAMVAAMIFLPFRRLPEVPETEQD